MHAPGFLVAAAGGTMDFVLPLLFMETASCDATD
jgi:hypothetical protein